MEPGPFDLQRQALGEGARGVQLTLQGAHQGLPGLQLQGQALGAAGLGLRVLLHPLELPLKDLELPADLVMLGDTGGGTGSCRCECLTPRHLL